MAQDVTIIQAPEIRQATAFLRSMSRVVCSCEFSLGRRAGCLESVHPVLVKMMRVEDCQSLCSPLRTHSHLSHRRHEWCDLSLDAKSRLDTYFRTHSPVCMGRTFLGSTS